MPLLTSAERTARRKRATNLRLSGETFDRIAEICEYANRQAAWKDVDKGLNDLAVPAENDTAAQLARIDAMLMGMFPAARTGDAKAVEVVLKLDARRAQIKEQLAAIQSAESEINPLAILRAEHNGDAK